MLALYDIQGQWFVSFIVLPELLVFFWFLLVPKLMWVCFLREAPPMPDGRRY